MIRTQLDLWKSVLRHRAPSILLAAILALTVAMPLMAQAADTKPAGGEALLENKP